MLIRNLLTKRFKLIRHLRLRKLLHLVRAKVPMDCIIIHHEHPKILTHLVSQIAIKKIKYKILFHSQITHKHKQKLLNKDY
jgi:hypothetical protein